MSMITSSLGMFALGLGFLGVDVYLSVTPVTHLPEPKFSMGFAEGTFLAVVVVAVAVSLATLFYFRLGFPLFRLIFTSFDKLEGIAKVGGKMVIFLTGLQILSVYASKFLDYASIFMFTHLTCAAKLMVGDDKSGILDLALLYCRRIVEVLLLHFIFPKQEEEALNLWEVSLMVIPACTGVFAMESLEQKIQ